MSPFLLKVILSLAMFSVTALAGLAAIMLRRKITERAEKDKRRTGWILTLLSCFAGGVFMGTCFLDIFPHINEHYDHFRKEIGWSSFEFPLPEFFVCFGFFLVYFLEELILRVFAPTASQQSQSRKQSRVTPSPLGGATRDGAKLSVCAKPDCATNNINGAMSQWQNGGGGEQQPKGSQAIKKAASQTLKHCASCLDMLTHEAVISNYLNEESGTNKKVDLLKSATFAFAISFHSILEGFALGVQENPTGILTLFLSLMIHKSIEAFSVGLQISKSGHAASTKSLHIIGSLVLAYALMTPIGAIIGDFITNLDIAELPKEAIIIVLESLAAGTFIYVTFLEVLAQERANDHSNLVQLGAILVGFLIISAVQLYEQATDMHSHGFSHSH